MKLSQAIKVVTKLAKRIEGISVEERIALDVVLTFAQRISEARDPLRKVFRAVMGDDDLNQQELPVDKTE